MKPLKVGIVGATGYTGSELVRLLHTHPAANIEIITSRSKEGVPFSSIHPAFHGIEDRKLESKEALRERDLDLIFLALPHRVSMQAVADLGLDGPKIIDLSGDFRLRSAEVYHSWYGTEHVAPELLEQAVFGLPELHRDRIREAKLVANPGCYPTASILTLYPLIKHGLIKTKGIVVDAKSGVTGAGAKAKDSTHFPSVHGNFSAYGLLNHRHTPEIEQELSGVTDEEVQLLFTPHLLPVDRGILATVYAEPVEGVSASDIDEAYRATWGDEPFVRLVKQPPSIKGVRGSNFIDIYSSFDPRTGRVLALGVIDNLVKGAAGQAVQNMNLMFGLDETLGLTQGPIDP